MTTRYNAKPETIERSISEVLMAIFDYYIQHNWWPTTRELMERTTLSSTSTINYHLDILCDEGYLVRADGGKPRAMYITADGYLALDNVPNPLLKGHVKKDKE